MCALAVCSCTRPWPAPTRCAVWEGFGVRKVAENVKQHEATHRTVLSTAPDTMVLPSGLMATLRTSHVCPCSVLLHSPVASSHTLFVWEGFGGNISHHYKSDHNHTKRLTARSCPPSPTRWSCHLRSRPRWTHFPCDLFSCTLQTVCPKPYTKKCNHRKTTQSSRS